MENKKKIIFYVDWTDCIAHLTEAYAEGETDEERAEYRRNKIETFFAALKKLREKYDVDIHCITGGSQEYLNGEGHGWVNELHQVFIENGCEGVLKSVATEYGGDLLVGPEAKLEELPFMDSERLVNEQLLDNIAAALPKELKVVKVPRDPEEAAKYYEEKEARQQEAQEKHIELEPVVELSFYKYFANIRFEDPNMTEEEFNAIFEKIKKFVGAEAFNLYAYYCPGYGVEIDVVPYGLDKTRTTIAINSRFYGLTPSENIALSVFNGDFAKVDLGMVDYSLTPNVLFVASEDSETIEKNVKGTGLKYTQAWHKLDAITKAMEQIALEPDLSIYNKGNYRRGR